MRWTAAILPHKAVRAPHAVNALQRRQQQQRVMVEGDLQSADELGRTPSHLPSRETTGSAWSWATGAYSNRPASCRADTTGSHLGQLNPPTDLRMIIVLPLSLEIRAQCGIRLERTGALMFAVEALPVLILAIIVAALVGSAISRAIAGPSRPAARAGRPPPRKAAKFRYADRGLDLGTFPRPLPRKPLRHRRRRGVGSVLAGSQIG
jgi:hypothetical protein